jgi:hypothetical protein
VSLDNHGHHNTIVAGTSTADSPEKVEVLGARSLNERSIGGDNLIFKGVVSAEAELSAEGGVTTTL